MSFGSPLWLLAVPLVLAVAWLTRQRGRSPAGRGQARAAFAVRAALLVALVLALADPHIRYTTDEVAIAFAVDLSDSVSPAARAEAEAYIREALAAAAPGDPAAVVVFGADVLLEASLQGGLTLDAIRSVPLADRTAVDRALTVAAGLLPEGGGRVVLLTDGRENLGDARAVARDLTERGVPVDGVTLETGTGPDAAVTAVRAPSLAREGETYEITATIDATRAGPATVQLLGGDAVLETVAMDLVVGSQQVGFSRPADEAGVLTYTVRVSAEGDTEPRNDEGGALVEVAGPPRVLLVGEPAETADLAGALAASGIQTDSSSQVPAADALLGYDTVVLSNMPAGALAADEVERLRAFVQDLGHGLVVVGGPDTFGQGGYADTPFEELLPVRSTIDDLTRRPSVAQALVIDTSGSMAACHCSGGGFGAPADGTGPVKTNIAAAGALEAIAGLLDTDKVGILAFNTESDWVLPMGPTPDLGTAQDAVGQIVPEGGTSIPQAIREAMQTLLDTQAGVRHILLFTDGFTDVSRLDEVAEEVAAQGITLSVIGTGEGAALELEDMADIGGGRYYPGADLAEIPQIFLDETITVTRQFVQEGSFLPTVTGTGPAVEGLAATPPLLGYVATTPKTASQVLLEVGPSDPLLATWRSGLGTVTTWTSDATGRWASGWVEWDGFPDFWGNVVRDTFPPDAGGELSLDTRVEGGDLVITATAAEAPGAGATATARIATPDGRSVEVTLARTGPGEFSARVPVSATGTYLTSVVLAEGGADLGVVSGGAVVASSPEFTVRGDDPTLVADLAALTDGRVDPPAADVFDHALGGVRRDVAAWPALALLALVLFPVDVALRRLLLTKEDRARLLHALRLRRAPAPAAERGASLPAAAAVAAPVATRSPPRAPLAEPESPEPARPAAEVMAESAGFVDEAAPTGPQPTPEPESTVATLLARKRARGR